ncbi:disulfide bond formation protein DsbA [Salmonella enterica subsp. enterica]|jgi:protein-disulfide isomerase|uniref:DsbA family protein n=1 Tax=Nitratireductor rhodophyticola TaxID=2854036 RepID=UPI00127DB628|nr:disulfide bond formation protein DsbA [Salmonella enterica subsp. enterica serovar Newport]ECI7685907.1 disulfide bond formation protein DsbA [Salmonella enterica subsp. enterica serovar Paratyphi A]
MNRRQLIVVSTAVAAVVIFGGSAFYYNQSGRSDAAVATDDSRSLVREYSPVIGSADAPVTIVEFFDPSCEACRAFYPLVKNLLAQYPQDVRLVLRYAAFHDGSDQAVGILEAARKQDLFEPVLEALLAAQPDWAPHSGPVIEKAWQAAAAAGLELERARSDASSSEVTTILDQESKDIDIWQVEQTPTFFVNGKSLQTFGPQQLTDLVESEVTLARNTQ